MPGKKNELCMKTVFLSIACCCLCLFGSAQKKVSLDGREESIYLLSSLTGDPAGAAALQQLFSSKTIIGLGEATHGTHEFYQVRTELLQFLIRHCGYRSVIFEGPFDGMLYINDYVLTGSGNIDSLLRRVNYWMYYTPVIRSFFTWLQSYNASQPATGKVQVFGMDIQSIHGLKEYLDVKNKHLPAPQEISFRTLMWKAFDHLRVIPRITPHYAAIEQAQLAQILDSLDLWLDSNKALLNEVYRPEMSGLYALCLKNFRYAIQADSTPYVQFRDSCMAANVTGLVALTGHKTAVWAHNGHIGRHDSTVNYPYLQRPLGELLANSFKEQYYPVGFLFSEGSFTALEKRKRDNEFYYPWLKAFALKPDAANRLATVLSPVSDAPFLIDLSSSTHPLWTQHQKIYTVGATYMPKGSNTFYLTPAAVFSGLIFIRKTTPEPQLDTHFYMTK